MAEGATKTYLHLPGGVTSHPLGVCTDCLFCIAIEANGAKVKFVGEIWVPKQVLNTFKRIAIEEEDWILCGVSDEDDLLKLPLWYAW